MVYIYTNMATVGVKGLISVGSLVEQLECFVLMMRQAAMILCRMVCGLFSRNIKFDLT